MATTVQQNSSPKESSKDYGKELRKYIIYHLQAGIPFNLPHILHLYLPKAILRIGENMPAPYSPGKQYSCGDMEYITQSFLDKINANIEERVKFK